MLAAPGTVQAAPPIQETRPAYLAQTGVPIIKTLHNIYDIKTMTIFLKPNALDEHQSVYFQLKAFEDPANSPHSDFLSW